MFACTWQIFILLLEWRPSLALPAEDLQVEVFFHFHHSSNKTEKYTGVSEIHGRQLTNQDSETLQLSLETCVNLVSPPELFQLSWGYGEAWMGKAMCLLSQQPGDALVLQVHHLHPPAPEWLQHDVSGRYESRIAWLPEGWSYHPLEKIYWKVCEGHLRSYLCKEIDNQTELIQLYICSSTYVVPYI